MDPPHFTGLLLQKLEIVFLGNVTDILGFVIVFKKLSENFTETFPTLRIYQENRSVVLVISHFQFSIVD